MTKPADHQGMPFDEAVDYVMDGIPAIRMRRQLAGDGGSGCGKLTANFPLWEK